MKRWLAGRLRPQWHRVLLPCALLSVWAGGQFLLWRDLPWHLSSTPAAAAMDVPQAVQLLAGQGWFGVQSQSLASVMPELELLGVLAGRNGSKDDFVIVREGGQDSILLRGHQTAGGWQLEQILAGSIILQRHGQRHEISLARTASPSGVMPAAAANPGLPSRGSVPEQGSPAQAVALPPATQLQD